MKDFFISYNEEDRDWAEWIAWQLEEAGSTAVIQAWDFRPGSNFIAEMQRAASEAQRTIAVLSPDYLASLFTQPEWQAAFAQDPTGEKRLLVPVRVRECELKGLLPQIVYIDLVGVNDEAAAREKLLDGLKPRGKPDVAPSFPRSATTQRPKAEQPRFPGALPPIWNVPHRRNPNFVGRDDLLDQIQRTLGSDGTAALTAIHGLGGVGKTQLAAEYAYRHAADYRIVWWFRSETPASLDADYSALAVALDLEEKHEREQAMVNRAVRRWLDGNGGWLIVFDNAQQAEDLGDYLPQGRGGHALITSRDPNWTRAARPLKVEQLARVESVKFLMQRTGQEDEAAADKLADALGDLPLALEQAGAYIETTGKPLAEYLALFQKRRKELLGRGRPAGYPDTVATTWEISFQEVERQYPAAAGLMSLCAFLAPDDFPLGVLRDGAKHLPDVLAEAVADEMALEDAIAGLRRYSLIERNEDSLSAHRLVQMVARDRLVQAEEGKWAESAVRVVNKAFPLDSDDVRTWTECARLLPHAMAAAEYGETLQLVPRTTSRLLNQAGGYFRGRAQYADAKRSHERSLKILEAAFGSDDADVAIYVNNLGLVLKDLGDLAGARECYERALRIQETAFGPDHPTVAIDVNNLGSVLKAIGDLAGARECFERALRIDEAAFGPNHPDVAIDLNNLGLVLQALGDLAGARECFERALRIDEAAFGPNHPTVAIRVNNLGSVLRDLGDLSGARQCYERALGIFRKFLGDDHPSTVTVRNNLESLKQEMGEGEP